MFTVRIFLLLFLLLKPVVGWLTFEEILCGRRLGVEHLQQRSADCQKAIAMIPTGQYPFDGIKSIPLNFRLPQIVRDRKFFMPAAFRSGNCLILVHTAYGSRRPPRNLKSASFMYTKVWPRAKEWASKIVGKCLVSSESTSSGYVLTKSTLDDFGFEYHVGILEAPPSMPGDGWKAAIGVVTYDVYEPGGTSSGNGTKGVWRYPDRDLAFYIVH